MHGLVLAIVLMGATAPPLDHARLPAFIREQNPEIRALSARVLEKSATVTRVGAWADPKLSLELMNVPMLDGPKITVMQMVPLQGQPGLMAEMAQIEAQMAEALLEDRLRMLTAEAKQALADLAYAATYEQILKRNQDLLDSMARISEAKYAVGKGMQADVLRAHLAKTKLFPTSYALVSQRTAALARLGAIAPGGTFAPIDLPNPPPLPNLDELFAAADRHNPMLQMQRLAVRHAELGLELAKREQIPDLELGVAAGKQMNDPMPYVSAMAAFGLPVWWSRKQAQRVTEAESSMTSAKSLLDDRRLQIQSQIAETHAKTQAMIANLDLLRGGLATQARQSFQASLAAYQVDQVDFLMVLDSQMALLDVEMNEAMVLADIQRMLAMLEALTGGAP